MENPLNLMRKKIVHAAIDSDGFLTVQNQRNIPKKRQKEEISLPKVRRAAYEPPDLSATDNHKLHNWPTSVKLNSDFILSDKNIKKA